MLKRFQFETERSGGGVIVNRENKTESPAAAARHQHQPYIQNVSTIVPNVKFEPTAPSPASSQ